MLNVKTLIEQKSIKYANIHNLMKMMSMGNKQFGVIPDEEIKKSIWDKVEEDGFKTDIQKFDYFFKEAGDFDMKDLQELREYRKYLLSRS